MLPVDAQMTARAPSWAAIEMAIVIPRSLNDPVGFPPSNFSSTRHPVSSESHPDSTRGVPPSHRLITAASAGSGIRARYSVMTPRQGRAPRAGAGRGAGAPTEPATLTAPPRSRA